MNILLINHYAGSPALGMEYRPYYLAREWVRGGHQVVIVGASFSHVRTVQPNISATVEEQHLDGITYRWVKTPPYQGNGAGRVANMCTFVYRLMRQARQLAGQFRPDVVIASSTYPLDIFPARKIAALSKARLVFEVHDLWPLSPIELGGMSRWHPFIALLQTAENIACRNCDLAISILPKTKDHLVKHGLSADRFCHVPNGIHPEEWAQQIPAPEHHRQVLNRQRQQGKLLVGYVGSHGIANALEALIDAMAAMQDRPVVLVLVGKGPEKARLEKKVSDRGLDDVIFLPPVDKLEVVDLLRQLDVLYIGLQKQSLFRFGISPNKLFDYMMAARPVIQAIDAGNDPVADSGCGITVAPEDPEAIRAAVEQFAGMPEEARLSMGLKGRQYVMKHHNYHELAKQFLHYLSIK